MENLIWDSVPVQRQRRGEKYNFAVVTMSAIDKPGAGRKFSFNKAAQEILGIQGEDRVSFGFSTDRTIIAIRKATGDAGLKLTKTCTISDKRTYDFITKILDLDITQETELKIENSNGLLTLNRFSAGEPIEAAVYEQEAVHTALAEEEEEILTMPAPVAEVEDEDEDDTPFVLAGAVTQTPQAEESSEEDVW